MKKNYETCVIILLNEILIIRAFSLDNANKSLKTQYISSSFDITVATVISKDKEYCNNNVFYFLNYFILSLSSKKKKIIIKMYV